MLLMSAAVSLCLLAPPAVEQPNLLDNPDMSEGWFFPAGWSPDGGSDGATDWVCSPDLAVYAVRARKGPSADWIGLTSSPRVPCTPGETLTVAGWVRTNDRAAGRTDLLVRFFTGDGAFLGQPGVRVPPGCATWTRLTAEVTVPERAAICDVSFQCWDPGAETTITRVGLARGAATTLCTDAPPEAPFEIVEVPRTGAPDTDADGLTDPVEALLGTDPVKPDSLRRATRRKTTSFQTHMGYVAEHDVRTDAVIVAGNAERAIGSWAAMGYEPHVMVGFRAGDDYVKDHPDEVQRRADGQPLTCGPGSYYMVPTERRREIFRQYFRDAMARGAKAACPEEAEYIGPGAYAPAFKELYQQEYGAAWEDPAGSIDVRYRCMQLMAKLEDRLLNACWDGARESNPDAEIFLLTHSPVNYAWWDIVSPHWEMVKQGRIEGLVGQVWTGTARTANRLRGVARERTFETAYLEYASLVGLTRDTGINLWFLMDPLEDNPDRTMEDYLTNYQRTLCASLFFPEVDSFEVMPWPARIFGRVPPEFATIIDSVVTSLADMQNQKESRLAPERPALATFVADSLQWQREPPFVSDFDSFFGLCLPFVGDGVPVQIAQLERTADPAYLARYRTLLLSYDAMKPMDPAVHEGLAEWVRGGGELLVFGGEDAYNALDSWWTRAGFARPQDHLFRTLGLDVGEGAPLRTATTPPGYEIVATTDYAGREAGNKTTLDLDLSPFCRETDGVLLRFEDSLPEDGWGPLVSHVRVETVQDGKPATVEFSPATPEEAPYLFDGAGLSNEPGTRFADGRGFFTYRFPCDPGAPMRAAVTIVSQYKVLARPADVKAAALTGDLLEGELALPSSLAITAYAAEGLPALRDENGKAVVFRAQVGSGTVTFCGIPPAWFCTAEGDDVLPRLLLDAPKPSPYLSIQRGPYLVARALEGGAFQREGRFVDLLSSELATLDRVELGSDRYAFVKSWEGLGADGAPALIASSAHVEYQGQDASSIRMLFQGPLRTPGVARFANGGRTLTLEEAIDQGGKPVDAQIEEQGPTSLLRFPCVPTGVAVRIRVQ
jgi:hypothetical protein